MFNSKPILFSEEQVGYFSAGVVTLNRPQALNSLNTECYRLLAPRLLEWEQNPNIALIVFVGAGDRAFCAGGDVKTLVVETQKQGLQYAKDFFTEEYFTDYLIYQIKKPTLFFADGITMGGGLGLMHGASHRIVTEKTTIAMPELGIGLFPDVGATHFLGCLKDRFGIFMGLTGARISAGDAVETQLADFYMPSHLKRKILADILRLPWADHIEQNHQTLSNYLAQALPPPPEPTIYQAYGTELKDIFAADSINDISERLDEANLQTDMNIAVREKFHKGSPLSKAVFMEACKRHRSITIRETFLREWVMAIQFSRENEFSEGVRAVLIDKDNMPKWPSQTNGCGDLDRFFHSTEINLLAKKLSEAGL